MTDYFGEKNSLKKFHNSLLIDNLKQKIFNYYIIILNNI